jgi:hypothetical protein
VTRRTRHHLKREPIGAARGLGGLVCAICLLAIGALGALGATATASTFAPKKGKAFHGVSDTGNIVQFRKFEDDVHSHPAVLQAFHYWGLHLAKALDRWDDADARGVLSITTRRDTGGEVISPWGIAHGKGDNYPLRLNREIVHANQKVYIRLMGEMNGSWNPYSAYDRSGHFRGHRHSQGQFIKAFRRFTLIVRGGSVSKINRRLRRLHLPKIKGDYENGRLPAQLPRAKVAMQWVPHSSPTPRISGQSPGRYWPGKRYVDWTGTDIFSRAPNWGMLKAIYRKFAHRPYVIGEYGLSAGDNPGFVKKLFRWSKHNKRSRMLIFYQGFAKNDPYRIWHYPASKRALRNILNSKRFIEFPAGTKGH